MSRPMVLKHGGVEFIRDRVQHKAEVAMAMGMANILQRLYPGHRWATFADADGGITWVSIPALMGPTLVYVIHIKDMESEDDMIRQLREAGGHILERFKLKRGEFQLHSFMEAHKKRIKDHKTPMPE